MALTPSTMVGLGTPAPDFSLPEPLHEGRMVSLADVRGERGTLVMFLCNHCPFVIHVHDELVKLGHDYEGTGIGLVAISSNDVATHPDDAPDKMAELARSAGYRFPYLYDETQDVARSYHAACTPDFFLFDRDQKLVYRGQLDDSRPGNGLPVTGEDLRHAMDAVVAGAAPDADTQRPSAGCNIKWKA